MYFRFSHFRAAPAVLVAGLRVTRPDLSRQKSINALWVLRIFFWWVTKHNTNWINLAWICSFHHCFCRTHPKLLYSSKFWNLHICNVHFPAISWGSWSIFFHKQVPTQKVLKKSWLSYQIVISYSNNIKSENTQCFIIFPTQKISRFWGRALHKLPMVIWLVFHLARQWSDWYLSSE